MIRRCLRVDSPLIISNPYMVRVFYPPVQDVATHKNITRKLYKLMSTTWGISTIVPVAEDGMIGNNVLIGSYHYGA